jgi:serine/threonine protein kinase
VYTTFTHLLLRFLPLHYFLLQWQAPSNIPVSEPCLDLLRHILVPDPAQRYSIAQIYAHPWFQESLPVEVRA